MDREDKQKQLVMDFLNAFGNEGGKRVLEALSEKCREHTATYVDGNPHGTAYKEGMRSVIIYIRSQLAKDPNKEKQKEARS
jgi:hypothetical protein